MAWFYITCPFLHIYFASDAAMIATDGITDQTIIIPMDTTLGELNLKVIH